MTPFVWPETFPPHSVKERELGKLKSRLWTKHIDVVISDLIEGGTKGASSDSN